MHVARNVLVVLLVIAVASRVPQLASCIFGGSVDQIDPNQL